MPHITVESGKLTEEQKCTLVERLTAVSSDSITIHEIDDASYGIGSKCIDVVKQEYLGKRSE